MRNNPLPLAAALLLIGGPALAVPLPVGDTPLPGTTVAARPELAGTVLQDRLVPYSLVMGPRRLTGVIQQRVVRETKTGTLDFAWRIRPNPGGNLPVISFRLSDFGPFITDGDWRIDGLGPVAPTSARVFPTPGQVNFQFAQTPVGPSPAQASRFFFLHTRAVRYRPTAKYDLLCAPSGCMTGSYQTFAPAP